MIYHIQPCNNLRPSKVGPRPRKVGPTICNLFVTLQGYPHLFVGVFRPCAIICRGLFGKFEAGGNKLCTTFFSTCLCGNKTNCVLKRCYVQKRTATSDNKRFAQTMTRDKGRHDQLIFGPIYRGREITLNERTLYIYIHIYIYIYISLSISLSLSLSIYIHIYIYICSHIFCRRR